MTEPTKNLQIRLPINVWEELNKVKEKTGTSLNTIMVDRIIAGSTEQDPEKLLRSVRSHYATVAYSSGPSLTTNAFGDMATYSSVINLLSGSSEDQDEQERPTS